MRRLDRRNAQRYDQKTSSDEQEPQPQDLHEERRSQSLPMLPSNGSRMSFRIDGSVDSTGIIRTLGLNGPEDFTFSADAWEARKLSSPLSDHLQPYSLQHLDQDPDRPKAEEAYDSIPRVRPPPLLEPTPTPENNEVPTVVADEEKDDSSSSLATEEDVSPEARAQRAISEWSLGKELGRGSFGTVYEAINYDGFFFAVKEVSLLDQGNNAQQCIQQLEHEIALLSHMEHQNIVRYLGTERGEAKLFIFLELVTQGSLAHLYQKYRLRDSQVSSYTRQILHGLKYLHRRNVVHRDIKCANILVDASGSVKLADFGLAKETSKINLLRSCKGSVYWMAPEVIQPQRTYGSAADIWSLGCTVLEMLTQNIPYPNLEWTQAFFKIGRGEKPPIPESLSSEARDFISQCVQENPGDRPDAEELLGHPFVRRQYSTGSAMSLDGSSHGRNLQET